MQKIRPLLIRVILLAIICTSISPFAQDNTQTVTKTEYYEPLNITSTATITGPIMVPSGHPFNIFVEGTTTAGMCNWIAYENSVRIGGSSLVFGNTVEKTLTPVNPVAGINTYEFWYRGIVGAHNWPDYTRVDIKVTVAPLDTRPSVNSISPSSVLPTEEMTINGFNFDTTSGNNIVRFTLGENSVEEKPHWVNQSGTALQVYAPADLFVGDDDIVTVQVINFNGIGDGYPLEILSFLEGVSFVMEKLQIVIDNFPAQSTADFLNYAYNTLDSINEDTYRRDAFNLLSDVMDNMLLAAKLEYDYGSENKTDNISAIFSALNDHICTRAGLIRSDFFAFKSKDLVALLSQALNDVAEYDLISQAIEQINTVQYQILLNNLNGLFSAMKQLDNILTEICLAYPSVAEVITGVRSFQTSMALNLLKTHYNDTITSGVPLDINPALIELGNIVNAAETIDIPSGNYGVALDRFVYYADVLIGPNDHPTPPDEPYPLYFSYEICICGVRDYGIKAGSPIEKPVMKDTGNTYTTCGLKIGLELLGANNRELSDMDWWYWGCEGVYYKLDEEALVPVGYCKRPIASPAEVTDKLNYIWTLEGNVAGTLNSTSKSAVYNAPPMEIGASITVGIKVAIEDGRKGTDGSGPGDTYTGLWTLTVNRTGIIDYQVTIDPPTNNVGQNPYFGLPLSPCPCGCCPVVGGGWLDYETIKPDDEASQPTQEEYIPVDVPVVLKAPLSKDKDKLGVICQCSGGSGIEKDMVYYKWEETGKPQRGQFIGPPIGKGVVYAANQPGDIAFTITGDDTTVQWNDIPPLVVTLNKTAIKVEIEKCLDKFEPKGGNNDNTVEIKATVTPDTVKGKFKFTLFDVSDEPGYCMNAPSNVPTSGEDSDDWKDLQFLNKAGFNVFGANNEIAETTNPDNKATVTINCYDYGAYGKIKVEFIPSDAPKQTFCAVEKGGKKCYTNIPLDDDENHIRDASPQNSSPDGSKDQNDDNDKSLDNTNNGDGLTRYQEYRGVDINNNGKISNNERLDADRKDLFIQGKDFGGDFAFAWGNAFNEAEIDVHEFKGIVGQDDRNIDVLVVTLSDSGDHIENKGIYQTVRYWITKRLGESQVGNTTDYGTGTTLFKKTMNYYFSDKPYKDGKTWTKAGKWNRAPNGVLDPVNPEKVEDTNDNGILDLNERDGATSAPTDDGDNDFDGDYPVKSGSSWEWNHDLSPMDINNNGKVELPFRNETSAIKSDEEYDKATVVCHIITHEIGHAVGIYVNPVQDGHCNEPTCLMYRESSDWKRDGHFCDKCREMIKIHNK